MTYTTDRSFIRIYGPDAQTFLQNIITTNLDHLDENKLAWGMLLTHQGKIQFDFFIHHSLGVFVLECLKSQIQSFLQRLTLLKMRADVTIEPHDDWQVLLVTADGYADPRHTSLPKRLYLQDKTSAQDISDQNMAMDQYHDARMKAGIIELGRDFDPQDVFPHDLGYDLLGLLDFQKGCYVGQEVVSRMQHKAQIKRRPMIVRSRDGSSLSAQRGDMLMTGEKSLGPVGEIYGSQCLAIVRLDRISGADRPLVTLKNQEVDLVKPDWLEDPLLNQT